MKCLSTRLALLALGVTILGATWPALVLAGALDPELEARLTTLPPGGTLAVIVEMQDQADPWAAALRVMGRDRRARLRAVVDALRDIAHRTQPSLLAFLAQEQRLRRVQHYEPLWVLNGIAVTATEPVIRALAARADVREVRLDRPVPPPPRPAPASTLSPPAPQAAEWNIARIRAPEVWALGYDGSGTVVGSFDTGVDLNHPDLALRYRGNHALSWFDPYGQHVTPYDPDGHGTHTTGTAVGGDAGGSAIGVAPGARWIAAKAWNDAGSGTISYFHRIFQWFLAPGGDPANAPDVVNSSWAFDGSECIREFQRDVQAFRAAGIFPAFAAGNSGSASGTVQSPAAYAEAFGVGATTSSDSIATWSSRGPSACTAEVKPDVTAPGASIRSAYRGGGYRTLSGTSMATPHVTGAVAVLRSIDPDLTVDELETILRESAADLGAAGADYSYGAGRIDLYEAAHRVLARNGGSTPPPGLPDLLVPVLSAPGSVAPGASFTVSDTTRNQGAGPAGPSTTRFYLSRDTALDPGDTALGARSVPSLAAGASSQGSTTLTLPASLSPGTYYLLARADADAAVAESDEQNNLAAFAVAAESAATADLVVSALSASGSVAPGASFTVSDTTRNQGTGPAGPSTTRFYLSRDTALDPGDTALGARSVPSLAAGASSQGSTTLTLPASLSPGTYYLLARADADAAVAESDEQNNLAARTLSVEAEGAGLPDLVVDRLSTPAWIWAGRPTTVSYTIRNAGSAAAPPTTTHILLSRSVTPDGSAVLLLRRTEAALAAGQSALAYASVTVPAGTGPGTYYLVVDVNAERAVAEAQATNNRAARAVRVLGTVRIGSWSPRALPPGAR